MAKRKTKAEKEADTKNLKQVLKARTKRKEAGIKGEIYFSNMSTSSRSLCLLIRTLPVTKRLNGLLCSF